MAVCVCVCVCVWRKNSKKCVLTVAYLFRGRRIDDLGEDENTWQCSMLQLHTTPGAGTTHPFVGRINVGKKKKTVTYNTCNITYLTIAATAPAPITAVGPPVQVRLVGTATEERMPTFLNKSRSTAPLSFTPRNWAKDGVVFLLPPQRSTQKAVANVGAEGTAPPFCLLRIGIFWHAKPSYDDPSLGVVLLIEKTFWSCQNKKDTVSQKNIPNRQGGRYVPFLCPLHSFLGPIARFNEQQQHVFVSLYICGKI
jgi:hypothetical protein